ncbi:MAG: 23S rRNA (guanosine(2251)-2'-O)-methyltransferase RlmB [Sulfurospirillum sp.]|nr:MAG: 23S rRNA (guanosine(2251)-2'-O)-methyltransferase RlmB [Sulfurospirillum sp.]
MVVYGKQIVLYIAKNHPGTVEEVYLAKEVSKEDFRHLLKIGKKIIRLDFKKAQSLAKGGNHQGFLLKIKDIEFTTMDNLKNSDFLLILVGLSDVGNIGAIIRSAYALGVDGVIISGLKSINLEAVIRTSAAAALEMPVALVSDTLSLLNELGQRGFERVAADMSGQDVRECSFNEKKVLLVGSEGEGIPKRVLKICDKIVKIKMEREFDSLNVSVATGILCDRMRS